jgi:phosphomannomutase
MSFQTQLAQLETAVSNGQLTAEAAKNIRAWLVEPRYAEYAPQVVAHIDGARWKELDDVFWTVIPFGTGGRRGKMYPIGSNAINDRTIGESAQGLADYVRQTLTSTAALSCAVAYDTRHQSNHFARLCAEIMVAAGFTVYFLDGVRSTPELSFAVREKACSCGIMVTASHNPPSDNAVKVYWSTGGQLLPPHDAGVIQRVMDVQDIDRTPFDAAVADGRVIMCQDEIDRAFVAAVAAHAVAGPREIRVIYSPLHGVGATAVCPVLAADGFTDVELFGPQAAPDGDFPNVAGHVANPERPEVFAPIIERARQVDADLVLASDPDCDRLGCAAPLSRAAGSPWKTLTGNQIGALLADFVLASRRAAGHLSPADYLVKTLVTTELIRRIGTSYGVETCGDLLVGFKWIGGVIDQRGADHFVFGAEESHGFLVGGYARDKDASVAAMLLTELAARLKEQGATLHERLAALFRTHGAHVERTISVAMPGSEGMQQIAALMRQFRGDPPTQLGGLAVAQVRDYLEQTVTHTGQSPAALPGPRGDLVILDLAREGNYVAIRPSGTEPKVKFYMFAYAPPAECVDLAATDASLTARIAAIEGDLGVLAKGQ